MNPVTDKTNNDPAGSTGLITVALVLLIVPFFFVHFPPLTDLPQQLAQIHLFNETVQGNADDYTINWWGPNTLVYLLLGACASVFPPPLSGKVAALILVVLWSGATLFLGWQRRRPLVVALPVLILVFNPSFYWGFVNFMIGWPIFVLWIIQSLKPLTPRRWVTLLVLGILLYSAHALWFLMGAVWLVLSIAFQPRDWKRSALRLTPIVPVGIMALIWFSVLSSARQSAGFDMAPRWFTLPFERLAPGYLLDSMLGGIKGVWEPLVGLAVLLWIVLAVYSNRGKLRKTTDTPLFVCALLMIVTTIFAPEKYVNTIYFAQRWFPCAVVLLVVALPPPVIDKNLLRGYALGLLLVFSLGTARAWHLYEKTELTGLAGSLDALPEGQRVLGLDFARTSEIIKGRPFLQTFAYAQVFKGGELNFSFAEHHAGIVRYKTQRKYPWTPALEVSARLVQQSDFRHFDYVLVHGDDAVHTRMAGLQVLQSATDSGAWRLYSVVR